ncbi:Leucine-rich receptor-like protein kinase family protein [Arabidopsis thaliana]|uniref:Receptor-like protein kinase 7 n=2 Tax=Arabidopsis thaliana TaxID=3702 RepID=RLK7_ARATH|nr:Leucine-rich receptor-like protein kinase family protein [Arabidopsis thaliana]F4I2N7.1 RecName: Full=Receptor-like protein kinase 7; Flags: Precursor [Arabidopsis thaliana]AEE28523.1 Leucine-rich receptor-like protein kinase family protein [Arabidopsis thaliana]|eukprot:NP_172468.3 Leucine-rich receptor-like protein kinase family protein [Arabidopsis thaliana]
MAPSLRNFNFFHRFSTFLVFSLFSVVSSDDLQVLLKLKSSFADSNLAVFDSWKLNSGIGPCSFIGVTCNSRGNVTEIDLSRRGLSGNFPFDSVCEIQSLEKLSLGFNSLSGIIPSDLKNCTSLKYLDLGNNLFSGAFPEFSSLNQLQFLYLNNSAFSGVFPWKSLRNATSLVVLSLGDNPFDATADFPVEVVSLKKLSWLYLSNCSIAGKIPPAIGDLTELRNLEISDSGLTGEIPSEISKLTNLWQLELYNNSLTGKLPTGFGNLKNLTYLDASTNLLQGDLSELRSLTNLVSLQMFENEFSGEIPLEFGEFKDLVNLSLYTNKLTGSLPQGLGSLADFDFIDASENLLTGPIPPDMCKNGKMKALLLLQNNLTGSIPESYANCLTLQRFRVSENNLNGTVPAGLWGLPKLEIIDIEMNNFEGPITADIKNGKMLGALYLGFNKLSDELPEEIGDTESLTKVELNNNRFTGKIPSSIGKLKGLSSLKMQSNGFSGEIPDSIGSCSMLSDVNMAQNSISGEIPHTLGSLPTLNALNLSDNKLSGRIPESLSSLRLSLLDLSNNRLSGRIPLSLSSYNGSFNGNPGLCSTTIKSFNRCINPSRSHGDTRVFVLCIVFGLLILLASLVFFLYLKKTEKKEGRSLKHESWSIKSFRKMSFTEDDIIDSIKEENLIGRGGCGDVYRVVLGDGKEVAVKHIRCSSTQKNFSSAMPILTEREGRSKEFETEVQTLSSIRHLNVVKLYCSITSDDSSLLVYEYLPNGSLWDMLHSCKKSNLGWETRYDIALGAAKGLEYLHHGYERPVIHRDVKSSNILLDEFLKPRIADFGLAKILQASNGGPESTHVVAGTYGYIAPAEYGYASKVTEKCDVYSFGVVLMELVTGKKPIEAEFGESKDIVNWVSNNLKSKESVMEIVDKKIGEMYREDAVKMLRIAIICTARLPGLRPTMRSVVQMIEDAEPCRLMGIVISKESDVKVKEIS